MGAFTQKMGMPSVIAFLVIIGEFFGTLALGFSPGSRPQV